MLVQPLDKLLKTIKLINEGKDIDAFTTLGLTVKTDRKLQGSFLERALQLSTTLSESNTHSGGLLVTPDSKFISNKELLSENLDINYMLTEDISMVTATAISSISVLSEGIDAIIDANGFNNIRNTLKEGLGLMQESLTNVFNTTSNITKKAFSLLNESSTNSKYTDLINSAILGVNNLITLKKVKEFADANSKALQESRMTFDMKSNSDTVLFSVLDLQESLIRSFIDTNKFNMAFITRLNENKDLNDISDYISGAIEQIAIPISEGRVQLKTQEMINSYNKSIEAISSLYDEYIQDYISK